MLLGQILLFVIQLFDMSIVYEIVREKTSEYVKRRMVISVDIFALLLGYFGLSGMNLTTIGNKAHFEGVKFILSSILMTRK